MDIGTALAWTAERYPDRQAVAGECSYSWAQWNQRANRIAHALGARGAARGERVCLVMSNGEAMAAAHLAAQKLGAVSTPLNHRYSPQELAFCIEDATPRVLISDDRTSELVRAALALLDRERLGFAHLHEGEDRPAGAEGFAEALVAAPADEPGLQVAEGDLSVMLYTAGTTGRPKGVPRTHANEHAASEAHVIQARYGPGERTLGAMPLYHTMGLRSLLSMVILGGTFVAMPQFSAAAALELIERERVSALYLVPTAYWALLERGGLERFRGQLRRLAYAGAAMSAQLCGALQEALLPEVFINHYGSTEIYTFCIEDDAPARPGSAGRPGLHSRIRLVTADPGRRVGPQERVGEGETGEIIASLRSPEAFRGYWHRPEATERALRDGWYFTGDLGYRDEQGNIHVAGRVDDMIISGGENVHPLEVEEVLAGCPAVAEVAVAGVADQKWGEAVTAFVVAKPGAEPQQSARAVAEWVRASTRLAPYKRPKRVAIVAQIPKSAVGKVLRRKLSSGEEPVLAQASAESQASAPGVETTR